MICFKCEAEVDPEAECCWNCGTEAEEIKHNAARIEWHERQLELQGEDFLTDQKQPVYAFVYITVQYGDFDEVDFRFSSVLWDAAHIDDDVATQNAIIGKYKGILAGHLRKKFKQEPRLPTIKWLDFLDAITSLRDPRITAPST